MRILPIRTVLVTTTVGCLVLLYLIWWTTYAETRLDERFAAQPPGAPGRSGGTSVTLLSLTRAPLLADQAYDNPPDPAPPGATWVVAVLEATREPTAPEFSCTRLELLGPEGRRWTSTSQVKRRLPWCGKEELTPATTRRFEMVFAVPGRYADQVVGIAVLDSSSADPLPVIRPPT